MGVGGFATAVLLTSFYYEVANGVPISIALVIAGLVCTARLIVSDHSVKEIYMGLFVGIISQIIGYYTVL